MEYEVSQYYCAPCDSLHCFDPFEDPEDIVLCFINNTNWMEGKF